MNLILIGSTYTYLSTSILVNTLNLVNIIYPYKTKKLCKFGLTIRPMNTMAFPIIRPIKV